MRLLYLFIIFVHICTAYGMDPQKDWCKFLKTDETTDCYASDHNPYLADSHEKSTQSQLLRRSSIGKYSDYLFRCLKAEEWWRQHPYKLLSRNYTFRQSDIRRMSWPPYRIAIVRSPLIVHSPLHDDYEPADLTPLGFP